MAKIEITRCDKCGKTIEDGQYHIDAGTYGIDLHNDCFMRLTKFDLLKILGLDEIRFGVKNNNSGSINYEKLIYTPRARDIVTTQQEKEMVANFYDNSTE